MSYSSLEIGDVTISFAGRGPEPSWELDTAYGAFVTDRKPDIEVVMRQGCSIAPMGNRIFDNPPVWSMYRQDATVAIQIFQHLAPQEQKRTLVFSHPLRTADLCIHGKSGRFTSPSYGPTLELLMINYLAQGKGAVIHTCGIERAGKGILFVGESGAGKSTLAHLWDEAGAEVLSDDRIIVRKKGDRFWMYGTPWHGDASFASRRGVTVERVLFLRQGRENSIKEIKGIDSVSRLITCGFLPHWDPQGMAFSMDFLTDLAAHVPCSEFTFKPYKSAIELVKETTT